MSMPHTIRARPRRLASAILLLGAAMTAPTGGQTPSASPGLEAGSPAPAVPIEVAGYPCMAAGELPLEPSASEIPASPSETAPVEGSPSAAPPATRVTVDELDVPAGRACTLIGTVIEGNLRIREGAVLHATDITVDGDVQGEGAASVTIIESRVDGNIQLEDGGAAVILGTVIDGDLQWERQSGPLTAEANTIDGNLQAEANRGGVAISGNDIDGDLQCQDNDPAPTGAGNAVEGDKEDQCSTL